jgi:hypothetical protein
MKRKSLIIILILFPTILNCQHQMMFGDTSRIGKPFSKDPHVTIVCYIFS